MPEIDFSNWPIWAIIIVLLIANPQIWKAGDKLLSALFGVSLRRDEAELEVNRWQRERATWREDKIFDLLEGTLEDYQKESEARDIVLRDLAMSLQTLTNNVGKQTDMIRILAQNAARTEDRLGEIKTQLASLETRWLRHRED